MTVTDLYDFLASVAVGCILARALVAVVERRRRVRLLRRLAAELDAERP